MNHDDEPGLSFAVRAQLREYDKERETVATPYKPLNEALPPEFPIEPGAAVAMTMVRYIESCSEPVEPNPWKGSGMSVMGVVAGINYGQADGEFRNHWRYRVVWQHETWDLRRPDGKTQTIQFTSEPGMPGWPHPWRHDLLIPMRSLPA